MSLHNDIMNIPCTPPADANINQQLSYKYGHRDARHAAAELVAQQDADKVDAQPAAGNVCAVYLRDNWDGEGDTYWILASPGEDGKWVADESGRPLLEHEGDAVLRVVPLDSSIQPDPAMAGDDPTDGELIELANKVLPGWTRRDNDLAYIDFARTLLALKRVQPVSGNKA